MKPCNERFTQGEWVFQETDYGAVVLCGQADLATGKNVIYMQEAVHDARLISAAPDMYRALRNIAGRATSLVPDESGIYKSYLTQAEVEAIHAALANADGE